MSEVQQAFPTMEVDVVIVGGGIQGLWLLADLLAAGYHAVLLERMRPGFGQTGHSHVFIHEGHIYASMLRERDDDILQRVDSLAKANTLWKAALAAGRLQNLTTLKSNFYIGWDDRIKGGLFEQRCALTNLPLEEVYTSPSEFGTLAKMASLYKSEGVCLESNALLNQLMNFGNLHELVACCHKISAKANDSGCFDFLAEHDADYAREHNKIRSIQVRAGAVVLSAGAGNETLIKDLFDTAPLPTDPRAIRQQTVKTFMLVLRHLNDSLPLVTGMFPDFGGIFIVSRQDSQGRMIWLIGDKQRRLVPVPGEMTTFDAITWFQNLKNALELLLPDIIENAVNYEWGIYEATKAERWTENKKLEGGGGFPEGYHIHKHPTQSIWLAWPTLLTFAPLVANSVVTELKQFVTPGKFSMNQNVWGKFKRTLAPSECRWKKTPLQSWNDFSGCFSHA